MTEPKWTPGPWTTSLTDETFVRSADNDVAVMIGDYSDDATSLIMAANANLIAAAPDLYASVERLLLEFDFMVERGVIPDVRDDIIFDNARAAMRKARGE